MLALATVALATVALATTAFTAAPEPFQEDARHPKAPAGDSRHQLSSLDRHAVLHYDAVGGDVHWVRGKTYKASAAPSGFTYIPFLGSDAPMNFPVAFRVTSISRDGETIAIEGPAAVRREADRFVLDHGWFEARYDIRLEGVEQSFSLPIPGSSGDLQLTMAVESECAIEPDSGGFLFSSEYGGTRYGNAIALDSAGRTTPVGATHSDGTVTLTVPGSFLEDVKGRLVIDPLMTTFSLDLAPSDLFDPDGAYGSNRYRVVAEERFSGSDTDLYSWAVSSNGTISDSGYADISSDTWENPAIAATDFSSDFLLVAESNSLAFPGRRDIVQRVQTPTNIWQPPFILRSATASYSCTAPDIGGDSIVDGNALYVYLRDFGPHRDLYTFRTLQAQSNDTPLVASSIVDVAEPAISKQTGFPSSLAAAWIEREISTGATSVRAAVLDISLGPIQGPFTVAPAVPGTLFFDVDVSMVRPEGDYLVTYDDRPASTSDAFVALCEQDSLLDTVELHIAEHSDRLPDQDNLRVAAQEDGFWLGCVEGGALHLTSVEPVGGKIAVADRRELVVGANVLDGSLAAFPEVQGNVDETAMFVWAQQGPSSTEIHGVVTEPSSLGRMAGTTYCYGTENSTGDRAFIQAEGNRTAGSLLRLRLEILPPNVFGYALASMTTASVPGAGGSEGTLCVGGSVGRFGIYQANAAGGATVGVDSSQIPQSNGPVSALAGQSWSFQSWFRDSAGGMATSNFTNGTTVLFL